MKNLLYGWLLWESVFIAGSVFAKDLGVSQCVTILSRDSQDLIARAEERFQSEGDYIDEWVKIRALKAKGGSVVTMVDYAAKRQGTSTDSPYSYVADTSYSFSPARTPAPTPRTQTPLTASPHMLGSGSHSYRADSPLLPVFGLSEKRSPVVPPNRSISVGEESSSSSSPSSFRQVFYEWPKHVSSPRAVVEKKEEAGVLYIRKLRHNRERTPFQAVNPTDNPDAMVASLCNYYLESTQTGGDSPRVYQICCGFEEVERTPDFHQLIRGDGDTTSEQLVESRRINKSVIQFLEHVEGHRPSSGRVPMYERGDVIGPFEFHPPALSEYAQSIKATVVGIGTSTVVFRYHEFEHPDQELIFRDLNSVLPKLAFRRIYFASKKDSNQYASKDDANQFYHHQMAQVRFLKENDIDILPVQFWKSDHQTVLIAQPFLKSENLLENYFEEIVKGDLAPDAQIKVLGRWMTVEAFLCQVTDLIIKGVKRLHDLNESFIAEDAQEGYEKIIEGFLDAKYPNYALDRDDDGDLVVKYFDLFPVHLLIFGRHPKDSNGHTQFEIFDRYFHRPEGVDTLVRKGMVNSYKDKREGYSNPVTMLQKLAASSLDLIYQNIPFTQALEEISAQTGNRYQLLGTIVGKINSIASQRNFPGEISMDGAIKYWVGRVKKNMLLRLALDFLTVAEILNQDEDRETRQVMSATSDESALNAWARELYAGEFCGYIQSAKEGNLTPDELLPLLRGMVERYVKGDHREGNKIEPVYDIDPEADLFADVRPLSYDENHWRSGLTFAKQMMAEQITQLKLESVSGKRSREDCLKEYQSSLLRGWLMTFNVPEKTACDASPVVFSRPSVLAISPVPVKRKGSADRKISPLKQKSKRIRKERSSLQKYNLEGMSSASFSGGGTPPSSPPRAVDMLIPCSPATTK
ncbi:hypothetical protein [Sansalvadorimonas verongulae]|uniref:hypothetical protein n=1 Tax=Sansalvadorimonas verongulae TaxID=2172824 RepID=UPI0012BD5B8E|nr:hypothetical protein [Sansalvadorimonas verongulae]MTI14889.1 hypothetical protein [Sansalvadorimonas verongulae]